MKDWLVKQLIRIQAPKWIRHALAAIGGAFASAGLSGSVHNVAELVAGVVAIVVAAVWSYFSKAPVAAGWWQAIQAFGEAVARQTVTALAGWLVMDPAAIARGEIDTTGVVIAALNLFLSMSSAPDAPKLPSGEQPSV